MPLIRSKENPIIEPADVKPSRTDFKVIGAFNAGVARYKDEVILLVRVAEAAISDDPQIARIPIYSTGEGRIIIKEFRKDDPANDFSDSRVVHTPEGSFLTSISHLRLARSGDSIHFTIEENPAIAAANEYETFGVEDCRITLIDGRYYINYTAVSELGVTTYLASTEDFTSYERHGVIFLPENKDVVIFPERIHGNYYALNRPSSHFAKKLEVWISESPDLIAWGNHRHVMGERENEWENERIGASAVPFRVNEGWLEIYHAATRDHRYSLGAVLLDADKPWKVLARSEKPFMEPEKDYEVHGFFGNVIFNNGVLFEEGIVKIYYGAADTSVGYAEIPVGEIMNGMK